MKASEVDEAASWGVVVGVEVDGGKSAVVGVEVSAECSVKWFGEDTGDAVLIGETHERGGVTGAARGARSRERERCSD